MKRMMAAEGSNIEIIRLSKGDVTPELLQTVVLCGGFSTGYFCKEISPSPADLGVIGEGWKILVSEEHLAHFSKDEANSVIQHEIGHCVLGHTAKMESGCATVIPEWEYAADQYAVQQTWSKADLISGIKKSLYVSSLALSKTCPQKTVDEWHSIQMNDETILKRIAILNEGESA